MQTLISLTEISKIYLLGNVTVQALTRVSLDIEAGSFVAIVGKSGSGKSTLLNIIGGMDKPTSGDLLVGDRMVSKMSSDYLAKYRRTKVGMIFQSFNLISTMTAIDNVSLPLFFAGVSETSRTSLAKAMLAEVGLSNRIWHKPVELSGGEQQRVAIARALITEPLFILADEPTGNLDSKTSEDVMNLLQKIHREQHKTIVMITHDMQLAERVSERIVSLQDGEVINDERKKVVTV
jgi:putative ABC transport system ATP-binding protein